MSDQTGSPLHIGQVLTTSYSVWLARLPLFFVLAFVAGGPILAIEMLTPAQPWPLTEPTLPGGAAQSLPQSVPGLSPWIEVPLFLAGILLSFLASAAATHMIIADLRGTAFNLNEALANGVRALPALTGVLLLVVLLFFGIAMVAMTAWAAIALGIFNDPKSPAGIIALPIVVVPAVIVWLMLSLVVPVIVVERAGVLDAMRRSAELTKGSLWHIFWVFVVYALILLVTNAILFAVAFAGFGAAAAASPAYIVIKQAILSLEAPFPWALVAVIYYYLRSAKEGGGATGPGAYAAST